MGLNVIHYVCSSPNNTTVRPQHIAIPRGYIISNTDGRPVLTFYVQLDNGVLSSNVLMNAVEVGLVHS